MHGARCARAGAGAALTSPFETTVAKSSAHRRIVRRFATTPCAPWRRRRAVGLPARDTAPSLFGHMRKSLINVARRSLNASVAAAGEANRAELDQWARLAARERLNPCNSPLHPAAKAGLVPPQPGARALSVQEAYDPQGMDFACGACCVVCSPAPAVCPRVLHNNFTHFLLSVTTQVPPTPPASDCAPSAQSTACRATWLCRTPTR